MEDILHRPRRSVLYVPGSNEKAQSKISSLEVDALIYDLEDAVAPAAKDHWSCKLESAYAKRTSG